MDKDKSIMKVRLSKPYKPYGYTHAGYLLDSLYAGKAWHTMKETNILAELPERRKN